MWWQSLHEVGVQRGEERGIKEVEKMELGLKGFWEGGGEEYWRGSG